MSKAFNIDKYREQMCFAIKTKDKVTAVIQYKWTCGTLDDSSWKCMNQVHWWSKWRVDVVGSEGMSICQTVQLVVKQPTSFRHSSRLSHEGILAPMKEWRLPWSSSSIDRTQIFFKRDFQNLVRILTHASTSLMIT